MSKILRVFFDTDMRCQHAGLKKLARDNDLILETIDPGEHVMFLNSAKNRVKIYSPNGVLTYMKSDRGMLDMMALAELPRTFATTGKFSMDDAIKTSLLKRLPKLKVLGTVTAKATKAVKVPRKRKPRTQESRANG